MRVSELQSLLLPENFRVEQGLWPLPLESARHLQRGKSLQGDQRLARKPRRVRCKDDIAEISQPAERLYRRRTFDDIERRAERRQPRRNRLTDGAIAEHQPARRSDFAKLDAPPVTRRLRRCLRSNGVQQAEAMRDDIFGNRR